MRQALEIAIDYMNERLEDHDCKYQRHPATEAERINILADIETVKEALAQPEQEEKLHPVHIGVDVTKEGTAVTAFYRKPDDVMEMFYSQFHPLAQPEQEPVAWITPDGEGFRIRFSPPVNDVPLGWDALYTTPPQRKPLVIDSDEKATQHMNEKLFEFLDIAMMFPKAKADLSVWERVIIFAPKRTWVGLDEEDDIDWEEGGSLRDLVEAVEAKLKEKNT